MNIVTILMRAKDLRRYLIENGIHLGVESGELNGFSRLQLI